MCTCSTPTCIHNIRDMHMQHTIMHAQYACVKMHVQHPPHTAQRSKFMDKLTRGFPSIMLFWRRLWSCWEPSPHGNKCKGQMGEQNFINIYKTLVAALMLACTLCTHLHSTPPPPETHPVWNPRYNGNISEWSVSWVLADMLICMLVSEETAICRHNFSQSVWCNIPQGLGVALPSVPYIFLASLEATSKSSGSKSRK